MESNSDTAFFFERPIHIRQVGIRNLRIFDDFRLRFAESVPRGAQTHPGLWGFGIVVRITIQTSGDGSSPQGERSLVAWRQIASSRDLQHEYTTGDLAMAMQTVFDRADSLDAFNSALVGFG